MPYAIIAVGREYGSGGRIIAQRVAGRLGFAFYDKELIDLAARESGLDREFISRAEQQKTNSFLYGLHAGGNDLPLGDRIFIAQSNAIKKAAQSGPCIIVGRCADYVLRENPLLLRVFIHAPIEQRIKRAVEEYGVSPDNVHSVVQKTDKHRASYYNHFTTGGWGRCQNYDLALNSGLGIEKVVDLLCSLAGCEAVKPAQA